METISLSAVRPEQLDHLLELVTQYYAFDQIEFFPAASSDALRRLIVDPTLGHAFFIRLGSEVIGYIVVTFGFDHEVGGRFALITDFYFMEGHRGKGYGTQALREVESRCPAWNAAALELQVYPHNQPAQALYRKFGFQAFDRIPMAKRIARQD